LLAWAVIPVMLVAGVLLGIRFGPDLLSTSDGLTWLSDAVRGEAVQVNPDTGRQENRLKVAPAGNQIDLAQREGLLVVTDKTTGTLTVIDPSALVTSGRWFGSGGGAVEVLLNKELLYVVDRLRGMVQRLDPLNARPLGPAWSAGGLIADAALDGRNTVWALRGDGMLSSLAWAPETNALTETAPPVRVRAAGPRSLVIPHDQGVTVVASEAGVVSRVGTGDDSVVEIPPVPGKINPAPQAPSDLVPVSAADSGKVLLFHRGRAITIDTGGMGCARPGEPVVFHGRVYVGCEGVGKVLVLGRDGERRSDIKVPAGAPKLTVNDDKLFIHVDGADTGVIVGRDGKISSTVTRDETQPVNDPDSPPPSKSPSKGSRQNPSPAAGGAPGATSSPPGPKVPAAPGGVGIAAQFEYGTTLRVEASWEAPADNGSAITGFSLVLTSDRGFSKSLSLTALRSGAIEIPCNTRCHGLRVQAEVSAANANGPGAVGRGSYTHNAPAVAPGAGDTVVTSAGAEEATRTTFRGEAAFNPPFAWRTFEGSCTLNYSGPATGSRPVSCWATTLSFTFTGGSGTYRFWMQAGPVKSNEVQTFGYHEPIEPPPCSRCQIP